MAVLSFGVSITAYSTVVFAGGIHTMINAGVTRVLVEEQKEATNNSANNNVNSTVSDDNKTDNNKSDNKEADDSKEILDKDDPLYELYGNDLVMSDVENSVNVRKEANEDSDIVGKMYKDCAGKIIEKGDEWTKIESGKVEGWVNNDYLCFGEEAVDLARQTGSLVATVNAETLRVRSEEDTDAAVYGLLAEGEKIEAIEEDGDWVKVRYSDDTQGYVSAEYVSLNYEIDEGETIEEITAREEAEAAKKKAEAEKKAKVEASRTKETVKTKGNAVDSSVSDQVLLAALIDCEAGTQPYEGRLAVGAVVVNRAKGRYGNIYNAIYAPGQFGPASSGKVAAKIASGPSASSMQAAAEAISGVSNVGTATHFRNTSSGYGGIVIGNHVFW